MLGITYFRKAGCGRTAEIKRVAEKKSQDIKEERELQQAQELAEKLKGELSIRKPVRADVFFD